MTVLGDPIDRMLEILDEMRQDRGPQWLPGDKFDRERRFLHIDEALLERLREAGIDPACLLFRPSASAPRRWVLTLADRQRAEHRPSAHADRGQPPLAGDNLTPRATDALPLSPSGYGALRRARADRDKLLAQHERSTRGWVEALDEVDALKGALAARKEMHEEHKAELRAAKDELAALCAHRDSLLVERDHARASAVSAAEWANTPIHRLLAAYDDRRNWSNPRPGDVKGLVIRERDPDWDVWIDWDVWTDSLGWQPTRCSATTLDEACTSAAEQIEAT